MKRKNMKRPLFTITVALLALLAIHPKPILAAEQNLTFTVQPGGSATFPIPVAQRPIQIAVSFSLLNGGTQTPSEVMYAVLNQDQDSREFSWVGTNNDGSVQAGTSIPTGSGPLIAKICGGSCAVSNATLEVHSVATVPGTLMLTVNKSTVSRTATFQVLIVY
jgi:hypothetical protein